MLSTRATANKHRALAPVEDAPNARSPPAQLVRHDDDGAFARLGACATRQGRTQSVSRNPRDKRPVATRCQRLTAAHQRTDDVATNNKAAVEAKPFLCSHRVRWLREEGE